MSTFETFNADTGCLSFQGELTIYEANTASENLCRAFESGALRNVDLAGVTELDTAGLQILLVARNLASPSGGCVTLVNHSGAVRDAMELTGLELTS